MFRGAVFSRHGVYIYIYIYHISYISKNIIILKSYNKYTCKGVSLMQNSDIIAWVVSVTNISCRML